MTWLQRNRDHTAMLQRLMRDPNYARHVATLGAASGMPLSENNADCSRPEAGSPTPKGDAQ